MSDKSLLLIDDDRALLQLLSQYLEKVGYRVVTAADGREGLRALYDQRPDLAILDIMMPKLDGWTVLERIRELSDMPVILLTGKGEEQDKLRGFRLGVDDYVTKPFSFAELAARVSAVLVRTQRSGEAERPQGFRCGELDIDLHSHVVALSGQEVKLTPTEFRLLRCLVESAGRVLSPDFILEQVWGPEYTDAIGYVRRYIWYLRQKIEPDPANPRYVITERDFGYRFCRR